MVDMLLEIPKDARVLELPASDVWFGDDGILYSRSKEVTGESNFADLREDVKRLLAFVGNKPVCIIAESNSRSGSPPREQRDAIAAALKSVTRALAIISTSPLSRMVANLFFGFRPPEFPMRLFSDLGDARRWISKYL